MPRKPKHGAPMSGAQRIAEMRARLASLSALDAFIQKARNKGATLPEPYTPWERREVEAIQKDIATLLSRATRLNGRLVERLESVRSEGVSAVDPILLELRGGTGKIIRLPVF